jgi:hypothetical protein
MRFDTSGLSQAFDKMRSNAESQGKDLAFVMAGQFLNQIRKDSREIAPTTEELNAVAQRLKGRLKRKPGVTPAKELARRQRAKGIFARKWKIDRKETSRNSIKIWLIDTSASSEKVDTKFRVSDKAEKVVGGKFKDRLNKMADNLTRKF